MSIASIDKNTEIHTLGIELTKLGIPFPELPEFTPLPATKVSEQDVIDALRTSTHEDPNQDPEVQRLFTALQVGKYATLGHLERQNADRARFTALVRHREALKKTVSGLFDEAAATIAEHAPTVATIENLGAVDIGTDTREIVIAAVTITEALATANHAHHAWWIVENLGRNHQQAPGPEYLGWSDPTVDEAARIESNGSYSMWNTARAGVALRLPQDMSDRDRRWRDLVSAREERRADQERERPRRKTSVVVNTAAL